MDRMKKTVLRIGALMLMALSVPVQAQLPTPPVPGCQNTVGDVYSEGEGKFSGTYDGKTFGSVAALERLSDSAGDETIRINGGDFTGWNFKRSEIANVCFFETDLSDSDWADVEASGIGFIGAKLDGAIMVGAQMPDILIRSSSFANVNASGADWSGGRLDGGWNGSVEKLNIDGANLTGFRFDCGITIFDGCPLDRSGISAKRTDFTYTDISSFGFYDMDVTGAVLNQTIISPQQVVQFENALILGPVALSGGDSKLTVLPETWAALLASTIAARPADKPSFDCAKARTAVEKEICGEYESALRQADREIASLYKRARKKNRKVKASQRAWLQKRNTCGAAKYKRDCLTESYDQRKGELLGLLGEQDWLRPGAEALFVNEVLPLTDEIRALESYALLTPVLAGAARANLYLKRNADGSIDAVGDAIGANAHTCSLGVKGVRFDRTTGWYSVEIEQQGMTRKLPVFRYMDGRVEIYRSGRLRFDDDDALIDYVSCGARASFPEMIRIELASELMKPYRDGPIDFDR